MIISYTIVQSIAADHSSLPYSVREPALHAGLLHCSTNSLNSDEELFTPVQPDVNHSRTCTLWPQEVHVALML